LICDEEAPFLMSDPEVELASAAPVTAGSLRKSYAGYRAGIAFFAAGFRRPEPAGENAGRGTACPSLIGNGSCLARHPCGRLSSSRNVGVAFVCGR